MTHFKAQQDMGFSLPQLPVGIIGLASGIDPAGTERVPTISGLIVALSIIALMLSLGLAAAISAIVWALG